MDILMNRERLLPALGRVLGVVERRQTLPILGNLLLKAEEETVTIVGTDLEVEVRVRCHGQVAEAGEATVPAKKFGEICRTLAEGVDIRMKLSGDRCIVTAGRGRYVLSTLPARDFPDVEVQTGLGLVELGEATLKQILEKTAFAMAQQDVRYYLNGMLLELDGSLVRAVATDGHRLACFEQRWGGSLSESRSVIVPFKAVNELRRQLGSGSGGVALDFGDRAIRVRFGDTLLTSKLVDGKYPDYERVIPSTLSKVAQADRENLRRALARTSVLSNDKYRGVRFQFESGVLRLQAHNPEQEEAVEEMEVDYEGESTTVGFNVAYLSDVLAVVDTEQVEVRFQDGNSSSIWRGVGATGETYVVMPMRL